MTNTPISQLQIDLEEEFVDLTLGMEHLIRDNDGTYSVGARAMFKGRVVAFAIRLGNTWELQELEGTGLLYWGKVELTSVGAESDAFVEALDEIYKTGSGASHMCQSISFTAVGLLNDPLLVATHRADLKLFYEHELDDHCAEIYLNIDANKSCVELREKDSDYRHGVILALSVDSR